MKEAKKTDRQTLMLEAAKTLFWKFGIRKVTVEEICKEAGVSKMTFYRAFANKDAIAERVVDELIKSGEQEYAEIMNAQIPFPEKINQLVELKYKYSIDVSSEFLKDLYQKKKNGLASKIEKAQAKQLNLMEIDFSKAQKEGWVNPDLSMDFIIYMLNDLSHKLEDEKLLLMYTHPSKLIMDLTKFFFYGIGNKDRK